ncbi:MAG TPA: YdcF family protein [Bryobacteraceae bacterium]
MRRAGRYVIRGLAAIGFLYVLVSATPIDRWWIRFLAGPWNDPKGEVLIVLGADSVRDVIGSASYWRSVYAVRVWRDGGFREVIVCGGPGGDEAAISERMRDFMVSQGVPSAAIRVETVSHSTRENALFSKPLIEAASGRKILLTSDYHMFRAYRVFRKAGIDVEPRPVPDALKQISAWETRWSVFVNLCAETAKIGYYFARGWI